MKDVEGNPIEAGWYWYEHPKCPETLLPVKVCTRFGPLYFHHKEKVSPAADFEGLKLYRAVMPTENKWVQIDQAFLNNKPDWLHGNLWVSFCCDKPVLGKYEWHQGWEPDRIITERGSDFWAVGIWVRPALVPDPPSSPTKSQSQVNPS